MFGRVWALMVSGIGSGLLLSLLAAPAIRPPQSGSVIISEVAWAGTGSSLSADEWIELYNAGDSPVNLTDWTLTDGGDINITLSGVILPGAFFLLERTDDDTVSDIPADQIYTGGLNNSGESLLLRDDQATLVDSANSGGGAWPAGAASPDYLSMSRLSTTAADDAGAWVDGDPENQNGLNANGEPINGTPRQPNPTWDTLPPSSEADLRVSKQGPAQAESGAIVAYQLEVENVGLAVAAGVVVTDQLPTGLSYLANDSPLPLSQPESDILVWTLGDVPTATLMTIQLTVEVSLDGPGAVTNSLSASTTSTETVLANNWATVQTLVTGADKSHVLLNSVLYDGIVTGDRDEAVQLVNIGESVADLTGWSLGDGSSSLATMPAGVVLPPGGTLWLARDAASFQHAFGELPDLEADDSVTGVPELSGSWPGFSNDGDEVLLWDELGLLADVLVYESGDTGQVGWSGPALVPYSIGTQAGGNGQILYRKPDPGTGLPGADTNRASDWAQDPDDVITGRRVRYAGWDIEEFFSTNQVTQSAHITVAVAPDNAFEVIEQAIDSAVTSIQVESFTFEHPGLLPAFLRALQRDVSVEILLEGGPVGGVTDAERYVCQKIEAGGGACWFMISDDAQDIADRYTYLHAKFMIIDGEMAVIGSENLSPNSLPDDNKSDGSFGRRGIVLVTDAPAVAAHLEAIFARDLDPVLEPRDGSELHYGHRDLFRWQADHPTYGSPPAGYQPITVTGGVSYSVRYLEPAGFSGQFHMEIVQSPENSLQPGAGLLALLDKAGAGDTILSQQLNEPLHWGDLVTAPNVRLAAMVAAARRGAKVRLLLDSYFADPNDDQGNYASCDYLREVAQLEQLDLKCGLGNPSGSGLHNKMVLVALAGKGYVHAGSLNGSELSHKGNREIALQVQSDQMYAYLADMFQRDWPNRAYLPLLHQEHVGRAGHVLISELFYDPFGLDEAEFVEIANPVGFPFNIGGFSLGDAVSPLDFEDVRAFPPNVILPGHGVIVVARSGAGFRDLFGFLPDYEFLDSLAEVPDMIDLPAWGDPAAAFQLGNSGDEVILRDGSGAIVDAVVYGPGSQLVLPACDLIEAGNSLERFPYWLDSDDCQADFRSRFPPGPGMLP